MPHNYISLENFYLFNNSPKVAVDLVILASDTTSICFSKLLPIRKAPPTHLFKFSMNMRYFVLSGALDTSTEAPKFCAVAVNDSHPIL